MRSYNKKKKPKHSAKINCNVKRDLLVANRIQTKRMLEMYGITFNKKTNRRRMVKKFLRIRENNDIVR